MQSNDLKFKKVLVVGAGGVGCNVLCHLSGIGIGEIRVCDSDVVDESNFNRQFLYERADIGSPKALIAVKRLAAYAPETRFTAVTERLVCGNAAELLDGCDIAVLACDNIETRLALNAQCTRSGTPLVNAGLEGLFCSAYLYIPGKTACLSCIYGDSSESRDKSTVSACAGAAGSLAARLAQACLEGDTANAGKLMLLDLQSFEMNSIEIKRTADCKVCGEFEGRNV